MRGARIAILFVTISGILQMHQKTAASVYPLSVKTGMNLSLLLSLSRLN